LDLRCRYGQQLYRAAEQYLAGFRSEAYQVELEDGFAEAQRAIRQQIEVDVRADIGGDQQRISSLDTRYGAITFKHILLPIWLAAYRYKGKPYQFVVNGQTGEVHGERPYSAIKIALAVALALGIAVGAYFAFEALHQQNAGQPLPQGTQQPYYQQN